MPNKKIYHIIFWAIISLGLIACFLPNLFLLYEIKVAHSRSNSPRLYIVPEDRNLSPDLVNDSTKLSFTFEDLTFQPEPVAAAWTFAATLREPKTVLVVDLGGGTSDFTVMRVAPPAAGRAHEVLATGGVRVGGDDFDGRIMWHRLVRIFGYGSRYESWGKMLDVPPHPFRAICRSSG